MKSSVATHDARRAGWLAREVAKLAGRGKRSAAYRARQEAAARMAGNEAFRRHERANTIGTYRSATKAPHPRHWARKRASVERRERRVHRRFVALARSLDHQRRAAA